MSTKIAFLNGLIYFPDSKTLSQQNFLISHKRLVGMGYLPDEDSADAHPITISNMWVIPHVATSCITLSSPEELCHTVQNLLCDRDLKKETILHLLTKSSSLDTTKEDSFFRLGHPITCTILDPTPHHVQVRFILVDGEIVYQHA